MSYRVLDGHKLGPIYPDFINFYPQESLKFHFSQVSLISCSYVWVAEFLVVGVCRFFFVFFVGGGVKSPKTPRSKPGAETLGVYHFHWGVHPNWEG